MAAFLSGMRPSLLGSHGRSAALAIGVDKLAVTRPVPEAERAPHPGLAGSSTAARNAAMASATASGARLGR